MSTRVDPSLLTELKEYGAINPEACFNCGNCTAVCPLTSDEHPFPRNTIRLIQMGMRERLIESPDPWMCYYCGECTQTCPKGAEPAETMMAARRWLTAQYDQSGEGARLYTSERAVLWTVLRYVVLTLVVFVAFHVITGFDRIVTDHVELNTFAPVALVWAFVLVHFAILGVRLARNTLGMAKRILRSTTEEVAIPFSVYVSEFKEFIIHFATQKRWRSCNETDHRRWLKHLLLISGYVTMLVLVVVLLGWFQTDAIYPLVSSPALGGLLCHDRPDLWLVGGLDWPLPQDRGTPPVLASHGLAFPDVHFDRRGDRYPGPLLPVCRLGVAYLHHLRHPPDGHVRHAGYRGWDWEVDAFDLPPNGDVSRSGQIARPALQRTAPEPAAAVGD